MHGIMVKWTVDRDERLDGQVKPGVVSTCMYLSSSRLVSVRCHLHAQLSVREDLHVVSQETSSP
jgi:hypothetical protein